MSPAGLRGSGARPDDPQEAFVLRDIPADRHGDGRHAAIGLQAGAERAASTSTIPSGVGSPDAMPSVNSPGGRGIAPRAPTVSKAADPAMPTISDLRVAIAVMRPAGSVGWLT